MNSASIGAIQRGLLTLEQQGAEHFFGEPMLDIADWMRLDASGKGVINILSAEKLYQMPKLYAASLLWMLSSSTSACRKPATSINRSWCSSSMRRICCSTTRRRCCWIKLNR